jgi:hypothetical protein
MNYLYKRKEDRCAVKIFPVVYLVRRYDCLVDENGLELNIFGLCQFGYDFKNNNVLRSGNSNYFINGSDGLKHNYFKDGNYIKDIKGNNFFLACNIYHLKGLKQENFTPHDVLSIGLDHVCGIPHMRSTWKFESGTLKLVSFNYKDSEIIMNAREFLESSVIRV